MTSHSLPNYDGRDAGSDVPAPYIQPGLLGDLLNFNREHGNHSKRIRVVARKLGVQMGLTWGEIADLEYGAVLHDIGKLKIRALILEAPRALTAEEWEEMRTHPALGADLVSRHDFNDRISLIVRHHHENYDGTGYPDRLAGAGIPLLARVACVVDAYDTMTSMRSYKPARSVTDALVEIERCAGTQFDPDVVREFVGMMRLRFAGMIEREGARVNNGCQ
jgi:putative nucleotidyltransferase with HDIG domain